MPLLLKSGLSWIVTLLAPVAILMLGVRLLLMPAFLQVEYRMPGFPADSYGFSMEERIRWATHSLLYLVNDQGIGYLAELMFDNGTPIYSARELSHMQDVKSVLQLLLKVWDGVLVVLAGLGIWAFRAGWLPPRRRAAGMAQSRRPPSGRRHDAAWLDAYRSGWRRGGFLMIAVLLALSIFALTSFWEFFTWFHSLFFHGDSWLFAYSDTLIRLFPVRFWEDCFVYIGGVFMFAGVCRRFCLGPPPAPLFCGLNGGAGGGGG